MTTGDLRSSFDVRMVVIADDKFSVILLVNQVLFFCKIYKLPKHDIGLFVLSLRDFGLSDKSVTLWGFPSTLRYSLKLLSYSKKLRT